LVFKAVPENRSRSPYAYIKSPDEKEGKLGGEREKGKEEEPWHWHTKQRHLMKAEMDDAFKVRKWVVVFMAAFGLGIVVGGSLVGRWFFGALRNWN
jgi:hypothetical protein